MSSGYDAKTWKELLLSLSDEEGQKSMVALLKLLQAAKETTRLPDGSLPPMFPAGDLVFELAKLHTTTMGKLAEIASSQAGKLLEHAQERRAGRRYPGHSMMALVSLKMEGADTPPGAVTLRNRSSTERVFVAPDLLELRFLQADGKECEDRSAYVQFAIKDAANRALDEICVKGKTAAGPQETKIFLTILKKEGLQAGPYRGHLILESTSGGPPAEIIVELEKVAAVAPPGAAATPQN